MFFQDLLSVSLVKFVNDFVQMFNIFIDFFGGGMQELQFYYYQWEK